MNTKTDRDLLVDISETLGEIKADVRSIKEEQGKHDKRLDVVEKDIFRAKTIAGLIGSVGGLAMSGVAWVVANWRSN